MKTLNTFSSSIGNILWLQIESCVSLSCSSIPRHWVFSLNIYHNLLCGQVNLCMYLPCLLEWGLREGAMLNGSTYSNIDITYRVQYMYMYSNIYIYTVINILWYLFGSSLFTETKDHTNYHYWAEHTSENMLSTFSPVHHNNTEE